MLLYTKNSSINFQRFGIGIPVAPNRARMCLEALRSNPATSEKVDSVLNTEDFPNFTIEDLKRVHKAEYVNDLYGGNREKRLFEAYELIDKNGNYNRYNPDTAEAPLSELFESILHIASGSYQGALLALEHGFSFYCGGGMHHAHYNFGHGFCVINDIVVTLRKLQAQNNIKTAWVIDVDAHKGDGTAALTEGDPTIRTLSIHMASGWPLDRNEYDENGKRHPSFIESDIDIPIAENEADKYLEKLQYGLALLDEFPYPDFALVVDGSDPYEKDGLPSAEKLKVSGDTLLERDITVYHFLKERNIPSTFLMAGGYGEYSWEVYYRFFEYLLTNKEKN